MRALADIDPQVAAAIRAEEARQRQKIELIASENYTSVAVMEATGSALTNKYAEGYPGRRYYGGCEHVDVVETLAIERVKALFGAPYANVQPHSGTQANMAAYHALLAPGDTVLAMDLAAGGHLSHGSKVNFSGQLYKFIGYGVARDSERIDYDAVAALARQQRPKLIVAGATAYSRLIDFTAFAAIAAEVGARLMVDMAHIAGLIAAGLHPNPTPHADVVTSTTHKTLRGPRGGFVLCRRRRLAAAVDRAVFPGAQGGPLMHVIAAKAVAFLEASQPEFAAYQQAVLDNARALAEGLQARGLRVVSGGTDNHLLLLDVGSIGLTGKEAEEALDAVGITTNKNAIPFDPRPAAVTSGLRLGTPAVTTRGFGGAEMGVIAGLIADTLAQPTAEAVRRRVADEVAALCLRFSVPGIGAPVQAL